jgi:hypothetical protein
VDINSSPKGDRATLDSMLIKFNQDTAFRLFVKKLDKNSINIFSLCYYKHNGKAAPIYALCKDLT